MTWQNRIAALEKRGWTLADIGRQIGLKRAAVCDIKKGRTRTPNGNAAHALVQLHATETRRHQRARKRR